MNQVTQAARLPKEREFQISGTNDISTNFKLDKNPKIDNPGSWLLLWSQFWETSPTGWPEDSSNIFPSKDNQI